MAGSGVGVGGIGVGVGGIGVMVGVGVSVGGMGVLVGVAVLVGVSAGGGGVTVGGTDVVVGDEVLHPVRTIKATIINVCKGLGFISISLKVIEKSLDYYSICTSNAPMSQGVSGDVCTIGRNPPR